MNEKRYSIIRVDKLGRNFSPCPAGFEKIDNDFVCSYKKSKTLNSIITNCKNCRYGDTKEQLIVKIQQALFKSIFTEQLQKAVSVEEQKRIYKQYRPMAEKVVEFLGVVK